MILELQSIKNGIDYLKDQSFGDGFLEDVRKKRANYIKAAQDNDFTDGIENLLTRLYPDNAHFVYELLQNAEDAGATKVYFSLQKDCLYFLHNGGKKFSVDDINSITSIGQSQKLEDTNKIGKFGVGFKSVFSYTNTPSVHSSSVSFLIKDMLMPSKLIAKEIPGQYTTLFIFPFNNPDKPRKQAYDEVFRLFNKLSNNTLLFLSGIQEINWAVDEQDCNSIKRKDRGDYIEIYSTSEDSSYWYVFTKKIHINTDSESGNFDVKIAYAFDRDKKAIVETRGGVSIFFPADSEVSELKFHIHAPFASTVARDSIVKDNNENQQLIQGIAELCCESFHEMRNNNMLNTSFFSVLPNKDDELSDTYMPIYERIIKEFEDESNGLIPIENNKFSNLQNCIFTKKNIKDVFDKNDLKILLDNEDIQGFAINASPLDKRTDKFLQSLNRVIFDDDNLIECLYELDNDVTDKEMQEAIYYEDDDRIEEINIKRRWLNSKSNEWLQSLYALLFDFSESWMLSGDVSTLTSIIKLSDSSFNFSKDPVYFLDAEYSDSEFKFANQATYLSGKKEKQKQKSKNFLEYVGVENLDESIHIKLLFQNYEFESKDQHIKDIDRLVQYYVDEDEIDTQFKHFSFIYTAQKNIVEPSKIAIDSPFETTGLQYVLDYQDYELLNPIYQKLNNINAFLDLIKSIGAIDILQIKKVTIANNPKRSSILANAHGSRWTDTAINLDWTIEKLEELLNDRKNRIEVSKLLWNTMCSIESNKFEAQYRWNSSYSTSKAKSQLIHIISNYDWIPGRDGKFYNPKNIDKELLPLDFIYDNKNGWLDHIEFGLNVQFSKDEREKALELVENIGGMSVEQLAKFKNTGVSPERLLELAEEENNNKQRLRNALDNNSGAGETREIDTGGVESEVIIDEDRLQGDIAEENKGVAIDINRSKVSVQRQNNEEVEKIKSFLYKQYKGHCQICGDTFLGVDNRHYYEMTSLNTGKNRDVNRKGNTLCLCPKHHVIFKLGLPNLSFKDKLPDADLDLKKIRDRYPSVYDVGRDNVINKNDGFYALPEGDDFELDVFLLPIRLFQNDFYIKFTQEHMQNFIEVLNNN